MKSALTWFELATEDLERAHRFYEAVLDTSLKQHVGTDEPMWIFPHDGGVGGALVHREPAIPGEGGSTVYLYVNGSAQSVAERAASAGGKVILPPFQVPGVPGSITLIQDTEGNFVGLHGEF